ncbi:MAG: efflux transporter outer membrane subunit [Planctomycetota bacterium]
MKYLKYPIYLFAASIGYFTAACTVGPDYKKPEMAAPEAWTQQGAGVSTRPADLAAWWAKFNDPQLTDLIERAFANNLDLKIAESRIREARASRTIAGSAWYPQAGANASYQRQRLSENSFGAGGGTFPGIDRDIDSYSATADATWELDIFGKTRRAVEAADATIDSAVESRRAIFVALLGDIARNYIELRGSQRQLSILNERVRSQQQTIDLTKVRVETGLAAKLDLIRAEALFESTRADIPPLESFVREASHRLSVLLGEFPGSLNSGLDTTKPIPIPPAEIPVGAPADVLLQRPDLRRAEREVAAASARIGAAVAEKYPKISLTTSIGPKATTLGDLFDHKSIFFSIGPNISIPLFQGGRLDANIEMQTEREKQAVLQFKQLLLIALEEVESGVSRFDREQSRRNALAASVAAQERAVQMAKALYEQGLVDFLNVLEAERVLLQAHDDLARSETLVSVHAVFIYKSLGGGWTEATFEE